MLKKTKIMEKRVAILATDGFEESELTSPKEAIEKAGFTAEIVSIKSGSIKSWDVDKWGKDFTVDKEVSKVSAKDYNALFGEYTYDFSNFISYYLLFKLFFKFIGNE